MVGIWSSIPLNQPPTLLLIQFPLCHTTDWMSGQVVNPHLCCLLPYLYFVMASKASAMPPTLSEKGKRKSLSISRVQRTENLAMAIPIATHEVSEVIFDDRA